MARQDVESSQPKDSSIDQDPRGGTVVARGGDGHALRLEGPEAVDDPGRDELRRGRRDADARAVGLRRRRRRIRTRPTRARTGSSLDQDPPGGTKAKPGIDGDDHRRQLAARRRRPVPLPMSRARPRRRRSMGGRSSEHEISLASARSVLEALDPARYEAVTVEIGRDGRWELGSGSRGELDGTGTRPPRRCPCRRRSVPATLADVDVVFPVLHGPFGEDGTVQGLLELAGRALRRRRRARLGALHGQGPVQGGPARPGHPGDAQRHAARGRRPSRTRSASRSSSSRRGSAPRSGSRRRATRTSSRAAVELAFRHDEKVLVEEFVDGHRGRVQRARQPASRSRRSRARSSRTRTGTTTRPSTTRAGWSSSSRRASREEADRARAGALRRRRSSPPSARAWPAPTASSATTARCSSTS